MTSWPILERQLRVWARRQVTYWGRFTVAAGGIVICTIPLLWTGPLMAPAATGRYVFNALVSDAFLLCCMACLLTADSISSERREGTLGLLWLTRMKPLDLLLGQLASSGLASVLGLVALMPLLALPLLIGGVSGGEVLRKAAALLDTLFVALNIGLWASAREVDRYRTACAALLLLTVFVLGPILSGLLLPSVHLELASPFAAISQAADLTYWASPGRYWLSLGLVQMTGWGFLFWAMVRLRRRSDKDPIYHSFAQVGPGSDVDQAASAPVLADPSGIPCSYCGRHNYAEATFCAECGTELRPKRVANAGAWTLSSAPTPLHWLLSRQRGLKPLLWVAAVISCYHLSIYEIVRPFIGVGMATSFFGLFPILGLAEAMIEGGLFAWVASRFFVEARRTGELELLLTTPLGAEKLVSTQWETLKRLARGPVVMMAGLPLILQSLEIVSGPSALWKLYYTLSLLLGTGNTVLGVCALFWLAPWFGLWVVGQGRVVFWTVLLVKGLPYVAGMAWSLTYRSLMSLVRGQGNSPWFLGFLVPEIATLLIYAWLIRAARRQLLHLGGTEPLDASQMLLRFLAQISGLVRRARSWPTA